MTSEPPFQAQTGILASSFEQYFLLLLAISFIWNLDSHLSIAGSVFQLHHFLVKTEFVSVVRRLVVGGTLHLNNTAFQLWYYFDFRV